MCITSFQISILTDIMVNPGTRGWMSVMSLLMVMMTSQAQQIQNQFYTVTAPDTVRPNTNYFAAISVEGTGGELQVILTSYVTCSGDNYSQNTASVY